MLWSYCIAYVHNTAVHNGQIKPMGLVLILISIIILSPMAAFGITEAGPVAQGQAISKTGQHVEQGLNKTYASSCTYMGEQLGKFPKYIYGLKRKALIGGGPL